MTWRQLVTLSLQDLRVYGVAKAVSDADEQLALSALNDWIDGLKTQGMSMFRIARTLWNLTGAASYTIGVGAVINVARPVSPQQIARFAYVNTNVSPTYEYGLGPPISDDQYEGIAAKGLTATYPAGFFYDPTYDASGFGTVIPYPLVQGTGLQGVCYSGVQIDEVTDLGDSILLPPGYRRFIRKALNLELAAPFRVAITDDMRQQAKDSRADVGRANERLEDISFGVAGRLFAGNGGKSNIYTGDV